MLRGMKAMVIAAVLLVVACQKQHEEVAAPPPAAPQRPSGSKFEPALVTFKSGDLTLSGFLYKPDGDGPFPAIVYNHGSEPLPGPKPDQASFYVAHGFVLFVPHRRGHGRSTHAGSAEPIGLGPEVIDALVA